MQTDKETALEALMKRYDEREIDLETFLQECDRLTAMDGEGTAPADLTEFQFVETQVIGHFCLLEGLDDGGMGQVWKALDLECQKHFSEDCYRALKFPRAQEANNQRIRCILKREAVAAKRLAECPHIVTVYDWHEVPHSNGTGKHVFVEMEYLQGHSFRYWLDTDWQEGLSFERVLELTNPVALALDFAHQKKLLHRDLKPANLFLTDKGEVKVLDFGIADEIRRTTSDSGYQPSEVSRYRTPSYMAPEASTEEPHPRQDVYSLACVIYELLTGRPPFYTAPDLPRHPNLLPRKPKALNEEAWQVLCRGFAYQPEERPDKASDLIEELRQAQVEGLQPAEPLTSADCLEGEAVSTTDSQAKAENKDDKDGKDDPPAWGKAVAGVVVVMGLGGAAWQGNWIWEEEAAGVPSVSSVSSVSSVPSVKNIHGWSDDGDWNRVQQLQTTTANALGMPVVFKDSLTDDSHGPEMVIIPAGKYLMGSPEDEPESDDDEHDQHLVAISRPFALGKYEVTTEEYLRCVKAGGCRPPKWQEKNEHESSFYIGGKNDYQGFTDPSQPIVGVSWEDAQAYANWLSKETAQQYRLPSESEWEYAARGGTSTPFYTGGCITTAQANYDGNYDYNNCGARTGKYLEKTASVGSNNSPNPFGLYDMAGNVWEWVQDCWNDNYKNSPPTDGSAWETGNCEQRVLRGGAWNDFPRNLRSANRNRPTRDSNTSGFLFDSWGGYARGPYSANRNQKSTDLRLNSRGFRLARNLPNLPGS